MRLLHPRRPHVVQFLLPGQLQNLGPHDRRSWRRGGHGRFPQLGPRLLRTAGGSLSPGLNDCVSGLKWVHANADALGIDPARIIVAGESGGGNLTLATGMKLKQDGDLGLIQGLYALCPFIAGQWPLPQNPSSVENEGILLFFQDNRSTMAYGIDAFTQRNPLAWPGLAHPDDVRGLPPVVISVNECDPLRDEGIGFYRLLLHSGVAARCRQVMGTVHGMEILPVICPDISRDTAASIADFARNVS
jgi:acetyl esterase